MIKSECRKLFSEKRKQLSDFELEQESEKILETLLQDFDLTDKTVSIFLPIKVKREINTFPLLNAGKERNIRFALPVADFTTNGMQHFIYENSEQISVSDYGIPEPNGGIRLDAHEIDIVITPLLCFDLKGYRVGYGKGFYDQFLSSCRSDCQFIGLSFFEPIEEITDVFKNDIRMHACITPEKTYRF